MTDKLILEDGEYPFIKEWFPLSDLAWIEVPNNLEALFRDQAKANNIELIRGRPVELRCMLSPQETEAVFMIYWAYSDERLHMLAPKSLQKGKA